MLDYARTCLALRFDKRGVTAVEYGLIAALMAAALIGIFATLTGGLTAAMNAISVTLNAA
jgi:pilus assembly protein Flp/PilA